MRVAVCCIDLFSAVDPNRIMQSLIAVLAEIGVPFLCTETHEMAEEVVASYLYRSTSTTGSKPTISGGTSPAATCEIAAGRSVLEFSVPTRFLRSTGSRRLITISI